jgi:hypothetical protein
LAGDAKSVQSLRDQLQAWKAVATGFSALAASNPALVEALPISADIQDLSQIGLEALSAIEIKTPPATDWTQRAEVALAKQAAAEKASATMFAGLSSKDQPPADLLILFVPSLQRLVEAAR